MPDVCVLLSALFSDISGLQLQAYFLRHDVHWANFHWHLNYRRTQRLCCRYFFSFSTTNWLAFIFIYLTVIDLNSSLSCFWFTLFLSPSSNVSLSQTPSSRPSLGTHQRDGMLTINGKLLPPWPAATESNDQPAAVLIIISITVWFFSLLSVSRPLQQLFVVFPCKRERCGHRQDGCNASGTWVGLMLGNWPLLVHLVIFSSLFFFLNISLEVP